MSGVEGGIKKRETTKIQQIESSVRKERTDCFLVETLVWSNKRKRIHIWRSYVGGFVTWIRYDKIINYHPYSERLRNPAARSSQLTSTNGRQVTPCLEILMEGSTLIARRVLQLRRSGNYIHGWNRYSLADCEVLIVGWMKLCSKYILYLYIFVNTYLATGSCTHQCWQMIDMNVYTIMGPASYWCEL